MYTKFKGELKPGMKVKFGNANEFMGKVSSVAGRIARIAGAGFDSWTVVRRDNGYWGSNSESGYLLAEKNGKILPVKYVVVYDLVDRDPAETFTSKKELDEWLSEARKNTRIIFDSIQVFEVTKHMRTKVIFELEEVKI